VSGTGFVPMATRDFQAAPIALRVGDFDAARAELEAGGVEYKGETIDAGICHQPCLEDPDGNELGVRHRYSPRG
jgi:hypothetical protein